LKLGGPGGAVPWLETVTNIGYRLRTPN